LGAMGGGGFTPGQKANPIVQLKIQELKYVLPTSTRGMRRQRQPGWSTGLHGAGKVPGDRDLCKQDSDVTAQK